MGSREDFEKWLSEWIGVPIEKIVALRSDDPDEPYYSEGHDEDALQLITIAYTAWQASRAAIEIELPEPISQHNMWNGRVIPAAENYDEALDDCADAIRAAGLRVKEK